MATKKTSGKNKKTASAKKSTARKSKKTLTAAPAEAVKAEAPAVREEAKAPAEAVKAEAPASREEAKAPAEAVKAEAPAVREEAKVPAEAVKAEAPAVREEAKAPAEAVKAEAQPAKEEAKAPAEAVKAEAQPAKEEAEAPAEAVKAEAQPAKEKAEAAKEAAPASEAEIPAEAPRAKEPAREAGAPATSPERKKEAEKTVTTQTVLKPNPDGSKLTPVAPRPMIKGNPYKPMAATVVDVIRETHNIKTIRVVLDDPEEMKDFTFEPGQVGQLSVFGVGESTFVINNPPSMKDYIQFSVMQAGEVTTAVHELCKGDKVGVRAPLGRPWPFKDWKGKNVFFIGGGIGMAPIRTVMLHLLEHKEDYGKISLLYGGKSPQDLAYSYELEGWMNNPDLDCTLTIDREAEGWTHNVGLIPNVLRELKPSPDNTVAVLVGPPIMIKFTLQALDELGFSHENVFTSLEKRMKCGIGICGRCGIGGKYVCLDGPVFSQKQLDELPPEL